MLGHDGSLLLLCSEEAASLVLLACGVCLTLIITLVTCDLPLLNNNVSLFIYFSLILYLFYPIKINNCFIKQGTPIKANKISNFSSKELRG